MGKYNPIGRRERGFRTAAGKRKQEGNEQSEARGGLSDSDLLVRARGDRLREGRGIEGRSKKRRCDGEGEQG